MDKRTLKRRVTKLEDRKFTFEELRNALMSVGIDSYLSGGSGTTMKPSLIAEKYIFDNYINKKV